MKDRALIVIDVQNCFCPGGSLAVPEGDQVVPVLNKYMELFKRLGLPVYATRDWHPAVTRHFKDYGGRWPAHCVQGTEGAEFHPDLKLPDDAEIMSKGMDPQSEGYSGFEGVDEQRMSLEQSLRERGIVHVYTGGLATDYCVRATTLDAMRKGFRATLLLDAVRGVEIEPGDSQRAIEEIIRSGARVANFKDVEEELTALVK